MELQTIILSAFYVFAAAAALSALGVISVKNPVHAALLLVLTFFSTACTWIVAGAEFLGVALILVYVGAVMVLFLFVVMMLDVDTTPMREGFVRYLPIGLVVAAVMLFEILTLIGIKAQVSTAFGEAVEVTTGTANTKWLAQTLYTRFLLPFELAAIILTVAVIAAVMLALRVRSGNKRQNPAEQAAVKAQGRVRMVKMAAEVPAQHDEETP